MNYLSLLSLLQKNFRFIQKRSPLRDHLLSAPDYDGLYFYLHEHESQFFTTFCKRSENLRAEQEELEKLQAQGLNFSFPGTSCYPQSFLKMPGAPILFSFRGQACWSLGRSIAVVGSREASQLSRLWMEESFAKFLTLEKPVVVSGGARGIDQLAHQLALRNFCPTVVVLPSGLGAIYPSTLQAWQQKIIEGGGCLLSEYPYHQSMLKHFFHDRNRLIAALGAMTLLVEAKRRSGSLLTAQKTLELGKSVFVVPGHPSDQTHLGNIDLLVEGATPVRDAEDLCTYFRSELRTVPDLRPITSQLHLL